MLYTVDKDKSRPTLRQLILNSYQFYGPKFQEKLQDISKLISVKKVSVYDGNNPGMPKTKWLIRSYSYDPESMDATSRKYKRICLHDDVTMELASLSVDETDFKLRTGSDCKIDFQALKQPGLVVRNGNCDFFFRLEWLYKEAGILYGNCNADRAPSKTNANGILFLDKHMLSVLRFLIDRGVIQ